MIYKLSCSILLLASSVLAQHQLMPGTLASNVAPDLGAATDPGVAPGPNANADPNASTSPFNAANSSSSDARPPITAKDRIDWVVKGTSGPESLAAGLFSAGWGTLFNQPKTYGPHWEGFGDRYGMRLSGIAASNTVEAGLGAIWGEDPRYSRDPGASFAHRLRHAARMTVLAENRDGKERLAYARFIAIPGTNFLSNSWRATGDDTANRAAIRTAEGFLGRFGGNTFEEFWPDI